MPVQVDQEHIDHSHIALTIQVPPDEFQKAVDSVFNQFARRTNVPGFRPGKAPKHLLKRYIDEGRVQELAVERAMTDAFRDALKQTGVEPYGEAEPQVELQEEELDPTAGFRFKATIALRPHVHLGPLEGLSARRIVTPTTEEEVDREIGRLLEQAAAYLPTEEGADTEDRVRATTEVTINGERVDELSYEEPTLFQIGANIEEFDAGLRGLRAGEEKTFDFTFPEDMEDEELQGKTATARVTAVEVFRRMVPEASDEFAQKVGFASLEELRGKLRDALQEQADALADQEVNDALLRDVVRASTVHYPDEMLQHEVSHRMDSLISALQRRGFTLDQYLAAEEKDLAALQSEMRQDAIDSLTNTLVLVEVARENGVTVTNAEVEAEVKRRAEAENVKTSQMRRLLNDTGEIDAIRNRIWRRKVAEFLRGKAEITEVQG